MGFPGDSDGKESACNAGDLALISGWGRSPGGEHGNSLVFLPRESLLTEEPTVHGFTRSQTRLSN